MTRCVCHTRRHSHKQGRYLCSRIPTVPRDTSSHSAFLTCPLDTCTVPSRCHMRRRCSYKDGRSRLQSFPLDSPDHSSLHDDQEDISVGTLQSHDHMTHRVDRSTFSHKWLRKYLGCILPCRCCPGNPVYRHRCHGGGDTPECSAGHTDTPQSSRGQRPT